MTTQVNQLGQYPGIPTGRWGQEDPTNRATAALANENIAYGSFVEQAATGGAGGYNTPRVQAIANLASGATRDVMGVCIIQDLPVGRIDTNFVFQGYSEGQVAAVAFSGVVVVNITTANQPAVGDTRGLHITRDSAAGLGNGFLTRRATAATDYPIGAGQIKVLAINNPTNTAIIRIWAPITISRA